MISRSEVQNGSLSSQTRKDASYPPVPDPPIISNTSQGFGGFSGSINSIRWARIIIEDCIRTPPPSNDSSLSGLSDIVVNYIAVRQ